MASNRYASGRVNSVYLTDDGLVTGVGCKVTVEGETGFATQYAASSQTAVDGTVYTQVIELGSAADEASSREFTLVLDWMPEALATALIGALNTALAANTKVRVVIDSYVDFDVDAMPVFQEGQLFTYEKRSGGVLQNARFRFISIGAGT